MREENPKYVVEAALFAAPEPLSAERLLHLFDGRKQFTVSDVKKMLEELKADYAERGIELQEVSSGYRFQAKLACAPWLQRLWEKKPPRYSRALLETLALIAYRQPISRGEIEEIRGVAVSSDIMKKLMDRDWIKVVGHRDIPGKPALFGTKKAFLDYFNLKSLDELPPLTDIVDLEKIEQQLGEQLALAGNKSTSNEQEDIDAEIDASDGEQAEAEVIVEAAEAEAVTETETINE